MLKALRNFCLSILVGYGIGTLAYALIWRYFFYRPIPMLNDLLFGPVWLFVDFILLLSLIIQVKKIAKRC